MNNKKTYKRGLWESAKKDIDLELSNKSYQNKAQWAHMAIMNTAKMGKFNSDRSIEDYVQNIWHLAPCK